MWSWVRLPMLIVSVQFKLNTDVEIGEFDSLRLQLRCVFCAGDLGWWGWQVLGSSGNGAWHTQPCCFLLASLIWKTNPA